MFGNDDKDKDQAAATEPVDQAAAAAADDQGAFVGDDDAGRDDKPSVLPAPSDDGQAASPFLTDDSATSGNPADMKSPEDDLLSIKQGALKQLSPLIGHLDQTPEEKFRTTMMMIQAADDQKLIKDAYEAAQAIGDEKVRAQALLDIINEINYFTQHQK